MVLLLWKVGTKDICIDLNSKRLPQAMDHSKLFCPNIHVRSSAHQQLSRISSIGASAQPFNSLGQLPV